MSESFIQLPPDSTGKRSRTIVRTIGGVQVHESVVVLSDPATGSLIDPRIPRGGDAPTYSAAVAASSAAASKHHLVLFNGSGSGRIVEVALVVVSVEHTAAVTGYNMGFRLYRTTSAGSGGTSITVNKMDTNDPDLPTQIVVWSNPTTAPTLGPMVSALAVAGEETGGTPWGTLYEHLPHTKPLTLREGQGITVQQYTTAGVGLVNVTVVFRVR